MSATLAEYRQNPTYKPLSDEMFSAHLTRWLTDGRFQPATILSSSVG